MATQISLVISICCNWLPFNRPYSFASHPFECFAKYYFNSIVRYLSIRFFPFSIQSHIYAMTATNISFLYSNTNHTKHSLPIPGSYQLTFVAEVRECSHIKPFNAMHNVFTELNP